MSRVLTSALLLCACIDSSTQRTPSETAGDTATAETTPDTTPTGEPCAEPGRTRCDAEGTAVEVCSDGAWKATSCGDNRLCVDLGGAQCLQASGQATCRELVYCYLACGFAEVPNEDACSLACYLEGTVQAQGQLAGFVGCIDRAECLDESGSQDTLDCIAEDCGTPLAQCYFPRSGDDACAAILTCREGCGGDEACAAKCGEDATLQAQGAYGVLELCLLHACAAATNELEQKTCFVNATGVGGLCAPFVRACVELLED